LEDKKSFDKAKNIVLCSKTFNGSKNAMPKPIHRLKTGKKEKQRVTCPHTPYVFTPNLLPGFEFMSPASWLYNKIKRLSKVLTALTALTAFFKFNGCIIKLGAYH